MEKNCVTCGNSSRKRSLYYCVTENLVDDKHICDGWVRPCTSGRDFVRAIGRAAKRLARDDWQIGEPKINRNYREVNNDLD